jgi:hypothetical protein
MATTIGASELSSEDKESLSKVDDVFGHLDWSSTRDHTTKAESGQKELRGEHGGFYVIPLEETEVSNITTGHNLLDSRSVQVHHIEPAGDDYSVPRFEVGKNYVASVHSLPEPEVPRPNHQDGQLLKDSSSGKELRANNTENEPNPEMHSSNFLDAESEDAAGEEWSDNNSDVFLSDGAPSSAPSSPPKFDDSIIKATSLNPKPSQPTQLQV